MNNFEHRVLHIERINCERSELLIWQVHQFGLGCIKTVHIDQSEYHFGTSLYPLGVDNIRYFFDLIFGKGFIYFSTAYVLFRGPCIR